MLWGLVQEYWPEVMLSAVSLVVGGALGRWQASRRFARREFFDRVNVSLNYVQDGKFLIRTLLERGSTEVFRNPAMARKVARAATERHGGPILALPDDDYWVYLNAVLNVISEQFADGFVRQESKMQTAELEYLLFLTSEYSPASRQRKIRAMLIREDLLMNIEEVQLPRFRNAYHQARWESLREVRAEWVESKGQTPRIREIAICV